MGDLERPLTGRASAIHTRLRRIDGARDKERWASPQRRGQSRVAPAVTARRV
jgi:hypothetical protein